MEAAITDSRKLAQRISEIAKGKLAEKLVVLDMREVTSFCDYFVIMSASSLRQTNAIAQAIDEELDKVRIKPLSKVSSIDESGWIVLDFVSVIVHIFYKPLREFYSLERLWADAKKVRLSRASK